tara:strand:+ start:48 stop:1184 length:1137 start_codon:yes stop_codon:yes gene_type:complete
LAFVNTENTFHEIDPLRHFVVPKLLVKKILIILEEEGFIRLISDLGSFSLDSLYSKAEKNLGFALNDPVRKRMVLNLLNILITTGYVERDGEKYCLKNGRGINLHKVDLDDTDKFKHLFESEISFYSSCIEYINNFLKGASPLYSFNTDCGEIWEKFLGNYEFSVARKILLQSLRIEDKPSFEVLDLCYGRGHDLELICKLYPRTKVTAIDFTDVFEKNAKEKVEAVQKKHFSGGIEVHPVKWICSNEWKGFGEKFPFEDKTFNIVFFACGDPYIPRHQRENVYKEIYRILKPSGGLGLITRCYSDPECKHVTNKWAKIAIYVHDLAEGVCENWQGFYGVEETMQIFTQLGFLPRSPVFKHFSILDHALWGLERPENE